MFEVWKLHAVLLDKAVWCVCVCVCEWKLWDSWFVRKLRGLARLRTTRRLKICTLPML